MAVSTQDIWPPSPGTGALPDLSPSPAGAYTNPSLTLNAKGLVTAASNGAAATLPDLSPSPAGTYTNPSLTLNAKGLVTAASNGASGNSLAVLRYNPARRAAAVGAGAASGNNFTLGWSFLVLDSGVSVIGAEYWAAWSGEKYVKFSLWDGDFVRVREKIVPVTGPALVSITFDSPYAVSLPIDVTKPLTISAWETSGLWYVSGPESLALVYAQADGPIQMTTARYGQGGDMFPVSAVGLQYPYGIAPRITIA